MQRTVEILFVVGIIVQLVKSADLILRPHQQKWLQNKFESLVLWFDYTKPFDWYVNREGAEKVYQPLYSLMMPLLHCGFIVFMVILGWGWQWWLYLIILVFILLWIVALRNLIHGNYSREWEYTILGLISPELEKWVLGWLFGGKTLRQHLSRHLIVIAAGVGAGFLFYISPQILPDFRIPPLDTLLSMPFILLVVPTALLGIVSLSTLIFSLLFLIIEMILIIVRGITWRIVEYNKGAFAAIVLIITVALGITELYLRYEPPPPNPVQSSSSP